MRHGRQARLSEVGHAGQARLASATAVVRSRGYAGEIEARYLSGAGLAALTVFDPVHAAAAKAVDATVAVCLVADVSPRVGSDAPRGLADAVESPGEVATHRQLEALGLDPAAHDVASGALRALAAVHGALGLTTWLASPSSPLSRKGFPS